MFHRYGKLALAVAGLVFFAATTLGQFPFGGFGRMSGTMLLGNPDVQKELNLSEEQITKVKEVGQQSREKFKDVFAKLKDTPKDQIAEKFQEIMKAVNAENDKVLKDVLKPEQHKRLKQIELQARGADAFNDGEIQKALGLSDEQKGKIKTITEDAAKESREIFQNAAGNFQEALQKMQTLRKETQEKAANVLTDAQKKTWKEMTGTPFELKFTRPNLP